MAVDVVASVRGKVAAGLLPLPEQAPTTVWAGPGSGKACDGCEMPITASDREYELDVPKVR
jgi:hypothetical protein